jgi:hypothetical protein
MAKFQCYERIFVKVSIINNKLYDKYVNGVWQNPYETKQVFAISSPIIRFKGLMVDVNYHKVFGTPIKKITCRVSL